MASYSFIEKIRIPLSRIFVIILICLIFFSQSRWESFPIFSSMLFLTGCFLVGIASLGRLWCSLYIAGYKNNTLVINGPYSMTRNPLYFFSLIGAVGVGLATETILIPFITLMFFWAYYPNVIKSEELRLAQLHGSQFESYRNLTPVFFPKLSLLKEPETYMVNPKIFKKNIFDALWFIWSIGILELIEAFHKANIFPAVISIY